MGDIQEGHHKSVLDEEINQLVEQLKSTERNMLFVGLDWFRDEFLPHSCLPWAQDPKKTAYIVQQAIEQRLLLTWRVPNPDQPRHPIKAVRVLRPHDLLPFDWDGGAVDPAPIRIKGGPISDTVIEDRAD